MPRTKFPWSHKDVIESKTGIRITILRTRKVDRHGFPKFRLLYHERKDDNFKYPEIIGSHAYSRPQLQTWGCKHVIHKDNSIDA